MNKIIRQVHVSSCHKLEICNFNFKGTKTKNKDFSNLRNYSFFPPKFKVLF